ncbi:MAG: tyrosine-protein phosphatase [Coriobacteriia bacterium]|nr:tyrosine-protein phosphatase [Coriobacteriia bacterium]MBS5477836.1 tyrosine-protein phosphatase [Coriobacteriia bacterium]
MTEDAIVTDALFVPEPLELQGAHNIRELGGYPTTDGGCTLTHRVLRGDELTRTTQADRARLVEYGLHRVIDLRSSLENEREPNPFVNTPYVEYVNIPMLDRMNSANFMDELPSSLGELYIGLLEGSGADLGRVMRMLAEPSTGVTLVHCTMGKDRTGVVSALLLLLAGVGEDEVVADYAATAHNMAEQVEALRSAAARAGVDVPMALLSSDPADMRTMLDHLRAHYGTAADYLVQRCGCDPEVPVRLRALLRG